MATGTTPSTPRQRPEVGPVTHYDLIIDEQLTRTRRRVKFVDLVSVLMLLCGAVILYLLVLVLVDHWIYELSIPARFVAAGALVLGVAYCCARSVIPLLLRPINPSYAAHAIEQCNPSLKNSLLNFLMFRRESTPTGRLVYRALQQRAALDLRQVNIDLAVDKSRLIYIGYLVAALMVLFVAYIILSPKDVFQTVSRIAVPWADIARPTRVLIDDVKPGDHAAILGSTVEVSARVLGIRPEDAVTLYYTTADKQLVDQAIAMQPPQSGQRYSCTIPRAEDEGKTQGIQQSLTFRIVAGDATSAAYSITMQLTPAIVVEKIVYEYPAYMRMPAHTSEDTGEIRGIEGTKVTVHATANYPIQQAEIQFDPTDSATATRQRMESQGNRAEFSFELLWNDSLRKPQYGSYQLDFEPKLGNDSPDTFSRNRPVAHRIFVTPDLPPEISILDPRRLEIDVPVNGRQNVELRAVDPDFGLAEVRLRATASGREEFHQAYPLSGQGYRGQYVQQYELIPGVLGYQVGDRVTLWAEAEDNCTQPNRARTVDYLLNIVAAESAMSGDRGDSDTSAAEPQGAADQAAAPTQQGPQDPATDSDSSRDAGDMSSNADSQSPQPNSTPQDREQGEQGQGEQGQGSDTSSGGAEQQSAQGSPSGTPQSAPQGEQTAGSQAGEGGTQESGSAGSESGSQQQGSSGGSASSGQQAGSTGDSPGTQGSAAGSSSSSAGDTDASSAGAGGTGANSDDPSDTAADSSQTGNRGDRGAPPDGGNSNAGAASGSGDAPGTPSKAVHDGEAIERILEHIQKTTGKKPQAGDSPPAAGASSSQQAPPGSQSEESASAPGQASSSQPSGEDAARGAEAGQPQDSAAQPAAGDPGGAGPGQPAGGQSQPSGRGENESPTSAPGEEGNRQDQPAAAEGSEASREPPGTGADAHDAGQGDQGTAGAGRATDNDTGAPAAQGRNADTDKQPRPNQSPAAGGATSPSTTQTQSDSQGDEGGTRSGGGEQGGGQSAQQAGRDSPGSTTSSEEGNSGAPESGSGDTAQRAGSKQTSADPTGSSGQEAGPGSQSQASPTGEQVGPDGARPDSARDPLDPGQARRPDQTQPGSDNTAGGLSSGVPDGGGIPSDRGDLPAKAQVPLLEGDAANLEYAQQATDLVLEHLRDQQQEPDPELLKSLDWTAEELRAFLDRWEALKRGAREDAGNADGELEDALRSLGLRDSGPGRRRSNGDNDAYRGLRDDGARSRPPASIWEQFNAYRKGAARGQHRGE